MLRIAVAAFALAASMPCLAADPASLRVGQHTAYDGTTDDLVTGGIGAAAMTQPPPAYPDPLHPTAAQLRHHALFQ